MKGAKVALGALVGTSSLLTVIAATTQLSGREPSDLRPLVVSGGIPQPGAAATALPEPRSPQGRSVGRQSPQEPYAGWAASTALSTGVPARALEAYAAAEHTLEHEQPGCHLSWPTLAGIGYVESGNGEDGGGLLGTGRPFEEIIGVALTGQGGVAAVGDTDGGELDHDATVDKAVGPLQFLPSTWRLWAADGDGDGVKDPQDIDDAALSAGRYLCVSGDLRTAAGWTAAVLSYNHSDDYLDAVSSASNTFAERSLD